MQTHLFYIHCAQISSTPVQDLHCFVETWVYILPLGPFMWILILFSLVQVQIQSLNRRFGPKVTLNLSQKAEIQHLSLFQPNKKKSEEKDFTSPPPKKNRNPEIGLKYLIWVLSILSLYFKGEPQAEHYSIQSLSSSALVYVHLYCQPGCVHYKMAIIS